MSNISRRKLLKSMAAGSGAIVAGKSLPESWTKPVVDSVMLPAHAQTSTVLLLTGSSANNNVNMNDRMYQNFASNNTDILNRVVEKLVPDASACPTLSDEWTCYAEKAEAPLNDPNGKWLLYVKQSKFDCECPSQERVWKGNVTYSGNESSNASVITDSSCGFGNADKHGELVFRLFNATDSPFIKIVELTEGGKDKNGKTFNLDVPLFDGGSIPTVDCCVK